MLAHNAYCEGHFPRAADRGAVLEQQVEDLLQRGDFDLEHVLGGHDGAIRRALGKADGQRIVFRVLRVDLIGINLPADRGFIALFRNAGHGQLPAVHRLSGRVFNQLRHQRHFAVGNGALYGDRGFDVDGHIRAIGHGRVGGDAGNGVEVGLEFVVEHVPVALEEQVALHLGQIALHLGGILAVEMHVAVIQNILHIAGEDRVAILVNNHVIMIAAAQQLPRLLRGDIGQRLTLGIVPALGGHAGYDNHMAVGVGHHCRQHVLIHGNGLHAGNLRKIAAEPVGFAALQVAQRLVGGIVHPLLRAADHRQVVLLAGVIGAVNRQTARAGAGGNNNLDALFIRAGHRRALAVAGHAAHQTVFRVDVQLRRRARLQRVDDLAYAPRPAQQAAVLALIIVAVGVQFIESAGARIAVGGHGRRVVGHAGIAAVRRKGLVAGGARVPFHAPEVHLIAGVFDEVGIAVLRRGVGRGIGQGEKHAEGGGFAVGLYRDFQNLAALILAVLDVILDGVGDGFLRFIGHIAVHVILIVFHDFFPALRPVRRRYNVRAIVEFHHVGNAVQVGQRLGVGHAAAVVQLLERFGDGPIGRVDLLLRGVAGAGDRLAVCQRLVHNLRVLENGQVPPFHFLNVIQQAVGIGGRLIVFALALQPDFTKERSVLVRVAGLVKERGRALTAAAGADVDLHVKAHHRVVGGRSLIPLEAGLHDIADGVALPIVAEGGLGIPAGRFAVVDGTLVVIVDAIMHVVVGVAIALVVQFVQKQLDAVLLINRAGGLVQRGIVHHRQQIERVIVPHGLELAAGLAGAHSVGGGLLPDFVVGVAVHNGRAVNGLGLRERLVLGQRRGGQKRQQQRHANQQCLFHSSSFLPLMKYAPNHAILIVCVSCQKRNGRPYELLYFFKI